MTSSKDDTKLKADINVDENVTYLVTSGKLAKLSQDIQKMVIWNVRDIKQRESGKLGELLGTKMPNMSVYSAFLLCIFLLLLVVIGMIFSRCIDANFILDLTKAIIPVFTMTLGYMFGKRDNEDK